MNVGDPDRLYARLLEHYQNLQRVVEQAGDFARDDNPRLTRQAYIKYDDGAYGLLKIVTVSVPGDPGLKRYLSWTKNVRWAPGYTAPEGERGSTVSELLNFEQAVGAIEGRSSP